MKHLTVLLLVSVLLPSASARAESVTDLDRFMLWNNCEPIGLQVSNLPADASDIGLTTDSITTAVRSRLRSARIYRDDNVGPYLLVNVQVLNQAFFVYTAFAKRVEDLFFTGTVATAPTWNWYNLGTHGRDAAYILSVVSQHTDVFLDEFLRVNADACQSR